MKQIFIINGPNLNLLGEREPDIYGNTTLEDLENDLKQIVIENDLNIDLVFMQSNSEGEIVDQVQKAGKEAAGLIINAGGLSHSSVSILDGLLSIKIPKIEVHISNLFSREEFRQHSYLSKGVDGFICGFGINGYALAIQGLLKLI
ncbi:MAG: type II 3-dehydroquinate dehydratase [Candidatus Pelagibacterales bacterium]|jgi:3-dehydroquinate dehydratase-2|nr:type II 3-dehydroquinate dehydratase [Pelagibacteraceae bacterium]MDC3130891.1 type II 3-dehydroquinate dehydratase [bacterium]|tara:strand:- start:1459 stop:1896 length:438 start_codon:yes stop_codon:yes gene_type:complete